MANAYGKPGRWQAGKARPCTVCTRPTKAADGVCDRHKLAQGRGLTKAQRGVAVAASLVATDRAARAARAAAAAAKRGGQQPQADRCTSCGKHVSLTRDWTLWPWGDGAALCSTCNDARHEREEYR